MNAAELRIGNWIDAKDRDGDSIVKVVYEIDFHGINAFVSQGGHEHEVLFEKTDRYDWYWVEGVRLTPELFKRMDVAEAGGGWFSWGNEGFDFSFDHQGFMDPTTGCKLHDYPILYVHQLQNFYFAKTGKELEIHL